MDANRRPGRLFLWLGVLGCGLLLAGIALVWWQLPGAGAASSSGAGLVIPGCKQAQTIQYDRCGHEVLRRVDAPPAWVGMTKSAVAAALDEDWRMTGFSPGVIEMTRTADLFCPQHYVLLLGPDGAPGMYRNRYGFAMERLEDVSLGVLEEETREVLVRGLAFDSREALVEWVAELTNGSP